MNLSVNIAGVTLKNPIVTASGTFGNGREISNYMDLSVPGAICVKAISLHPRLGNKPPRIAETAAGMLNSVGLQNNGVHYFIENDIPFLRGFDTKIIANISGHTIEENCEIARLLDDKVDLVELNISCPNVAEGGMAFGTNAEITYKITESVKKACAVPLIVKLSPNVTDIAEIARAAEAAGADALSLINTLLGMKIDIHTRRPILSNGYGGLSGPAIKPVAVRMVHQVKNAVGIPIIGMGGVFTGGDAAEFILAGATAVAVGTANLVEPNAAERVLNELCGYMEEKRVGDINSLIGGVMV